MKSLPVFRRAAAASPYTPHFDSLLESGAVNAEKSSPFPLKRILVLSDLSAASTNAVWRAALLARDHGASLHILHVGWTKSAAAAAQGALDAVSWELQERLQIAVVVRAVGGSLHRELAAAARDADLMVIRTAQSRPIRDWLRGGSPERLIRVGSIPALVVKRPAAVSYQRVLVSLDSERAVAQTVSAALGMTRGPHAEVLRALEAEEGDGAVPSRDAGPAASLQLRALVQAVMKQHEVSSPRSDPPTIAFDHPAPALVAKGHSIFADLIVIAGRQYRDPPLGLRRTNTSEILSASSADVLILSPRAQTPENTSVPAIESSAPFGPDGLGPLSAKAPGATR